MQPGRRTFWIMAVGVMAIAIAASGLGGLQTNPQVRLAFGGLAGFCLLMILLPLAMFTSEFDTRTRYVWLLCQGMAVALCGWAYFHLQSGLVGLMIALLAGFSLGLVFCVADRLHFAHGAWIQKIQTARRDRMRGR